MDGVETNIQGGVCGKETVRRSQGRRGKTLQWFRRKHCTQSAALERAYIFFCASPTSKSDARFARRLLDNISAASTQAVTKGGQLAELSLILAISIDTVAAQQKEIKRMYKYINAMKNKGTQASRTGMTEGGGMTGNVRPHCAAVGRTSTQIR